MMQISNLNIALMLILAHLTITSLGMAVPSSTRTTSSSSSSNGGAKGGIASTTYDLLVVGGGSAGLTAAKFAATFGKSVAIIEKEKLGGDCTWTGCIPSKSLIASSKAVYNIQKASSFGINIPNSSNIDIDMKAIKSRIQNNIQQIYEEDDSPEAMKKLGIDTIVGKAMFQQHENMQNGNDNEKTKKIQVTNEQTGECSTVYAKYGVLICTGAKPTNPNIPGLVVESKSKSESKSDSDLDSVDLINYLTYEHAFEIDTVPKSLTVVGGGPIGVELAQAYSRLGAKVTIIANKLLPREEPEASDALQRVFENEGIVVTNSILSSVSKGKGGKGTHLATCQNGETITGDMMLVSVGRKPVVDGMGLSDLGVEINDAGGIQVDKNLETTVKGIYAAGDCTGDRQFTHYAGYQGAVGARNILLPFSDPGVLDAVPGTTFTDPQIASVGMTEEEAKKEYGSKKVGVAFQEVKETDRGICDNIDEGYIKVVYLKKNYKILGASIMSPVAGELIAEICVAMKNGMSFDMMATVIHTYPSHSFALQSMAAELYYDKLVKLRPILNFLKWIGL